MMRQDFDISAFLAALDAQREAKGISWRQVARETGVSVSTLVRIQQGKLPDAENFAAIVMWLGTGIEPFWRDKVHQPETLASISLSLHNDLCLSKEDADLIDGLVRSTYKKLCKGST